MSLELVNSDLRQLEKELFRLVDKIGDNAKKREIIAPAVDLLKDEAKRLTPKGTKVHHRYKTAKLSGGLRAPNGLGQKVATYLAGNLRNSIVDITSTKKKYRKSGSGIIGPVYRTRALKSGQYGSTEKNADGYYAHMIFGSAKSFRQEVTGRALSNKRGPILQSVKSELLKFFKTETDKGSYIGLR